MTEYKGTVFSGEAPESDDEVQAISNVKLANAQEVTETFHPSDFKPARNHSSLSLLQQCLGTIHYTFVIFYGFTDNFSYFCPLSVERNHLLWTHLNQCVQNTAAAVSSQVIATEQLLIQSQIKVQAATQKMKEATENTQQIATKLNNILTTDFLPDIKLPSNT